MCEQISFVYKFFSLLFPSSSHKIRINIAESAKKIIDFNLIALILVFT